MSKVARTRIELFEHYSQKPATPFHQFDGFAVDGEDHALKPDSEGDSVMTSTTWELMSGAVPVRVLIPTNTEIDKDRAARLLRKIADCVAARSEQTFTVLGPESADSDDVPFAGFPVASAEQPDDSRPIAVVQLTRNERKALQRRALARLLPKDYGAEDLQGTLSRIQRLTTGDLVRGVLFGFKTEEPHESFGER